MLESWSGSLTKRGLQVQTPVKWNSKSQATQVLFNNRNTQVSTLTSGTFWHLRKTLCFFAQFLPTLKTAAFFQATAIT